MECIRKVTNKIYYIGGDDRRITMFENLFPVENGVAYNSYFIEDEKLAIIDTVDHSISRQFFENIESVLKGRSPDYLVIQHMEPDHCACIKDLVQQYPNIKIIATQKTVPMLQQFFNYDFTNHLQLVKEGDQISLGETTLQFIMAPMVHWPEVMMTYVPEEKALFSSDAFGSFGALNGNLFNSDIDYKHAWLEEARRYYANIVGKFGLQVQSVLKKVSPLEIEMLCPLHGVVWDKDISYFVKKYSLWSSYLPEQEDVMIVYGSIYGNTENAVNILANKLGQQGVKNIAVFDVSKTDISYIIGHMWRCKTIVLATPTYNNGIFPKMDAVIEDMVALGLKNRVIGLVENGTWASMVNKLVMAKLEKMKNITVLETKLTVKSSLNGTENIEQFVAEIIAARKEETQ